MFGWRNTFSLNELTLDMRFFVFYYLLDELDPLNHFIHLELWLEHRVHQLKFLYHILTIISHKVKAKLKHKEFY